jgi:cytochrome c5
MTLLQANAEAVRTHYRHADPLPAATALTAFVTGQGTGRPRTPGVTAGQPTFPPRLAALARSAAQGGELFGHRCAACHAAAETASALDRFPRVRDGRGESLERFLEAHAGLPWDSPAVSHLVAFLAVGPRRAAPGRYQESP